MKLIVGLGNPGRKYEQTRHNVGFMVASKVAVLTGAGAAKVKFEGELAEGNVGGEKLAILCPGTFMNASGRSVRKAVEFFKLELCDVLVVCDDLNLAGGQLRVRPSGSAGGQNGIKDIIRHLGTESFPRLRVGIDRPPEGWSVTDYVLGKFSKTEHETFETATSRAAQAAICWATEGVGQAMNQFNVKPNPKPKRRKAEQNETSTPSNPQPEPRQQESAASPTRRSDPTED
ncbi:aminoacyl-tRNA hydrolase [Roseiconus nitratireducens]|uniref:Peptidyl-tRNA hydrolase n=1 Tax=Roseiconus nitratireducens TaxID=2605748 RepID=A0A5M6DC46_9BACT|nr:aminoacyl-tRNA hydrolase [Roseiconus nitratireducens]KAA5545117.1 aminoacyl-tRNA hydrolase [Roseiconus nitratireducens]